MKTISYAVFSLVMMAGLCLGAQQMFEFNRIAQSQGRQEATGVYRVTLSSPFFENALNSEFVLAIPGWNTYTVIHDKKTVHENGDITWTGYLKDYGKGFRATITQGGDLIIGRIATPEGILKLRTQKGELVLINQAEMGLIDNGTGEDDYLIPDARPARGQTGVSHQAVSSATTTTNAVIDLMILYNTDMATAYPGTALDTRLNELVSMTNQAYIDSQVHITMRLVHTEEVDYTSLNDNSAALQALTDGTGVFSNISTLRTQYGADLVSLIRPFDSATQISCGSAWLNGLNGQDISLFADSGYSVISDGNDGSYYCDDYSLAHELGHNLGNEHDRDHASGEGAYSYSFGYDQTGDTAFATIMSYDKPIVGYFSNPDITGCNGNPCGVAIDAVDAANNALSMNNTRDAVAAFMNEVISQGNTCLGDCDNSGAVSISEVQSAVNQYLSQEAVQSCNDMDGDLAVSISEVQTIVNNYLNGCP